MAKPPSYRFNNTRLNMTCKVVKYLDCLLPNSIRMNSLLTVATVLWGLVTPSRIPVFQYIPASGYPVPDKLLVTCTEQLKKLLCQWIKTQAPQNRQYGAYLTHPNETVIHPSSSLTTFFPIYLHQLFPLQCSLTTLLGGALFLI